MTSYLILGGSRNIGHHVAHLLLNSPTSSPDLKLTLLVRRDLPADDTLLPFVASGRVIVVKGDATIREDVLRAWDEASKGEKGCEAVLFAIGAPEAERTISFTGSLSHINPTLCTHAMANLLSVIAASKGDPKLIAISTTGLGPEAHARLPVLLRGMYGWMLHNAHEDKIGMEHLLHLATVSGPHPLPTPGVPSAEILSPTMLGELQPAPAGWALSGVTIVKAALLMDDPKLLQVALEGGAKGYEAEVGMWKPKVVAREEVARFVVEECLGGNGEWKGKVVDVSKRGWW